jgi:hypothetical protein
MAGYDSQDISSAYPPPPQQDAIRASPATEDFLNLASPPGQVMILTLENIQAALDTIAQRLDPLTRLADTLAPVPQDVVGTPYVAKQLGCTVTWVAEMVRKGDVPQKCIVPGTGKGKPWKFYREQIDAWLARR